MDINYELYKVFYYVATTLSFSEAQAAFYLAVGGQPVDQGTGEKAWNHALYPQYKARAVNAGGRNAAAPRRACDQPDCAR